MGIVDARALHLLSARERGWNAHITCWLRLPDDIADMLPHTSEAPDPAYWTAYDYHMIESDARAMRRAHVYSMIAVRGNRLWQHSLSIMRGLGSAVALTIRRRGAASR